MHVCNNYGDEGLKPCLYNVYAYTLMWRVYTVAYCMPSKLWPIPMQIAISKVFKTMDMGFNTTVTSVKPHYIFMGFDLHTGGAKVGTLNEPCNSQDA